MHRKLTPELILAAYRGGMFPMADSGSRRLYWFSPDPRCVLEFERFHVPRSLRQVIRRGTFEVRIDTAFDAVIDACGNRAEGTWISDEIKNVYRELHRMGWVHSVESWGREEGAENREQETAEREGSEGARERGSEEGECDAARGARSAEIEAGKGDEGFRQEGIEGEGKMVLAGGLYGVAIGGAFFGESMFFRRPDASKVALAAMMERLRARGFTLVDIQWPTPHLEMFGAVEIPRDEYLKRLAAAVGLQRRFVD